MTIRIEGMEVSDSYLSWFVEDSAVIWLYDYRCDREGMIFWEAAYYAN